MPIEGLIGLFVLVLAAMGVGWLLARWGQGSKLQNAIPFPRVEYFKGLNYLLDEQPDKAIEVFIRMVEVDSETVETHFALASLFRRRGEVDRAIRLHQNLIARPNLTRRDRNQALRELGEDYMRAGLLDRAESLFLELVDVRPHMEVALRHLVAIYEQQKDWDQAVAMRRKLEAATGDDQNAIVAHYFCEMAAACCDSGDWRGAQKLLKRAQAFDRDNVRVGMMFGKLALQTDEPQLAVRHYRRALESDILFATEVLPPLAETYRQLGQEEGLDPLARAMTANNATASAEFAVAAILHPELATPVMEQCVGEYVRTSPALRGLHDILGAVMNHDGCPLSPDGDRMEPLQQALRRLLTEGATYRCGQCGYAGTMLYWQCPSCRTWGSTTPFHDFSLAPRRQPLPPTVNAPVRVHSAH
ncbi:MAG TPA: lipopolysaccharide assembly protein LapB [Gammaproteobacteria bacterium]|nr:lipopolysaccharide assembly protein LapB [Gammaproteobacteria bacterium]